LLLGLGLLFSRYWPIGTGLGFDCPFRALTGLPCPFCGLTRSVLLAGSGHWTEAMAQYPLIPLIFTGLAAGLVVHGLGLIGWYPFSNRPLPTRPWAWILFLLLAANWGYRLALGLA
jgi:hypothetical protein